MKLITAGGRQYELRQLTGEIIKCEKRIFSHTAGKNGTHYHYHGNTYTSPITINTNHIIRGQVFLKDSQNREHVVNLAGFNLDCREGDQLNIVWAIPAGQSTGPCIAVRNLQTESRYFDSEALKKIHRSSSLSVWVVVILVLPVAYISGNLIAGLIIALLVILTGTIILIMAAGSGTKKFKSNFSFDA